ncbi:glycosyltransferase family 4 protein [Micromonospora sp. NPDC002389]|uniref:glycosyltransferase family 4 protein n=1 Tax=Micromonospora sp. NPDC002389 TaxID=3154272 RepID=UPI0033279DBA
MSRTSARDVAIVTPWYPTRELPFRGAFVRAMTEATAPGCDQATVYHCDGWWSRLTSEQDAEIGEAQRLLLPQAQAVGQTVGGAGLRYVPVPMPGGLSFADIARRHEATLALALGGRPIDAPVVHAHVGLPSGWAALHHLRPDARFFVTEHATFLDRILAEPDGHAMYDQVLHRCDAFFAVGDGMRDLLVETFPHHADRISIVPNPISFEHPRPVPVTELRRWLFLGGLIPRKGVTWLLEAFAVCHADDPRLTLSLVGDGELSATLQARAAELGIADAVTFAGAVSPDEALRLMREHDLLVHPSRMETFGMTVVEALAAGMPVLVTRCGGPEETLAGIEDAAGELVAVEESPDSIVAGYRRLRSRFPDGLDLELAQRTLDDRYGYPAVARAHHRVWFPEENSAADAEGGLAPATPEGAR